MGIFLEPELRFSSVNSEIVLKDVSKPTSVKELQKYTQSFQKIDLPLMVGFKAGPVRINAGPVGTIVVSSKSAISELADYKKYEEKINTASWGFQAGVGMDFGKLGIDLRYEGGLSKLGNGVTVAGQTRAFDQRQRQVILSLSYMIKND